jgi:hypothetical protein
MVNGCYAVIFRQAFLRWIWQVCSAELREYFGRMLGFYYYFLTQLFTSCSSHHL